MPVSELHPSEKTTFVTLFLPLRRLGTCPRAKWNFSQNELFSCNTVNFGQMF